MLDRLSDDEVSRQILGVFMRHRLPASGILAMIFSAYATAISSAA
jgi:hypothetical protein